EHNAKITEEQKTQICNSIDCNKLSPQLLLHAVQNPRMPLRFVVRAMLVEQLNTRRSILSAANHQYYPRRHRPTNSNNEDDDNSNVTLGEILQRDATKRETAQLKAAMDATSSRIQTLEKQLLCMKKLLQESDHENVIERSGGGCRDVLESGRSASFHYGSGRKIERAYNGAPASASFRFSCGPEERALGCSSSENSGIKKNIGQ
ncbi:hypothetical protein Gorai_009132, partial [Gossypium raimondii]|nr:hypothetical protein [Gossypium raimondii]